MIIFPFRSTSAGNNASALDAALASWRADDVDAALASLGEIQDDGEKDRLNGGIGRDELLGGVGDSTLF